MYVSYVYTHTHTHMWVGDVGGGGEVVVRNKVIAKGPLSMPIPVGFLLDC